MKMTLKDIHTLFSFYIPSIYTYRLKDVFYYTKRPYLFIEISKEGEVPWVGMSGSRPELVLVKHNYWQDKAEGILKILEPYDFKKAAEVGDFILILNKKDIRKISND